MGKKKKAKSKKSSLMREGPGDAADDYRGPIEEISAQKQIDTSVRLLSDFGNTTATAGGVFNTVFASDPTSMNQWSSISGQYDEYRVLAIELHYIPMNRYNQTLSVAYATAVGPFCTTLDLNSTVAITGLQAAVEFASMKIQSASDPLSRSLKAQGKELMVWSDTNGVPTRQMAIKTRVEGLTPSVQFGNYVVRRLIQFRGTI